MLANPPFIAIDEQPESIRQRLVEFMSTDASGRIDTYLAFLKLAIEALKPGGYGLFVLPYAFLIGDSAAGMARTLSRKMLDSLSSRLVSNSSIRGYQCLRYITDFPKEIRTSSTCSPKH